MKESFIFYRSFFEAIKNLDDKKRLKMYDLIANFALNLEEIDPKFEICEQLFILIKPQLVASHKHYEDGCKGGRPKKIKNPPFENKKTNINENINENENENENINIPPISPKNENEEKEEKKEDIFINPVIENFSREYKKVFNTRPPLMQNHREKILELNRELEDFKETIPEVLGALKTLNFPDVGFKPNIMWLLKDDNYIKVKLGEFTSKKEKSILDFMYDEKDLVENG